ncbi:MAG TPA: copper resistance CopC family protein [Chthoniobacterales bacterium]|jgi:methionine-rich copper-binding protein CopC
MKRFPLFLVLASTFAISASGHSTLERSEPKDGAVLKQAPNEIMMWFTEPLRVQLSTIDIRDSSGKQVDRGDLHADKKQPTLLHLSLLPPLGPGTYKVSWNAVAQDMHVSKGSLVFRVSR